DEPDPRQHQHAEIRISGGVVDLWRRDGECDRLHLGAASAMIDLREDILARLLEVVATIPNIKSAARNRNNSDIPEDQLPAAIVFDGDEDTDDATDVSMRPPNRPTIVHMAPEILILQ